MSKRRVPQVADLATSDLLGLFAGIVEELRKRAIVRSSNNPAADYAEWLAARALDLELVSNSVAGYDAVDRDGRQYQVKARRVTASNGSRQLSAIRGLAPDDVDPFDVLVGILFNADFAVARAAAIPVAVVRELARWNQHVNAWRFILRDSVWERHGVEDITDRIRAAADEVPMPIAGGATIPAAVAAAVRLDVDPGARQKAEPDDVRRYFVATGLNRRELARILGVGIGLIGTVQNPNGDRRYGRGQRAPATAAAPRGDRRVAFPASQSREGWYVAGRWVGVPLGLIAERGFDGRRAERTHDGRLPVRARLRGGESSVGRVYQPWQC